MAAIHLHAEVAQQITRLGIGQWTRRQGDIKGVRPWLHWRERNTPNGFVDVPAGDDRRNWLTIQRDGHRGAILQGQFRPREGDLTAEAEAEVQAMRWPGRSLVRPRLGYGLIAQRITQRAAQ